jgi:hypothetical protein
VTVDEAAAHLRQMLLDARFGFDHPDPALAWEVFKRFIAVPVESAGGPECEEAWFEAGDGRSEEGWPGYFDFVRQFLQDTEAGAEYHEQVTVHFTCEPGARVGIPAGSSVRVDLAELPEAFAAVESSPAFRAGLGFAGWSVEVRVDVPDHNAARLPPPELRLERPPLADVLPPHEWTTRANPVGAGQAPGRADVQQGVSNRLLTAHEWT